MARGAERRGRIERGGDMRGRLEGGTVCITGRFVWLLFAKK